MKTWIKNPAATWTGNQATATNGIVVEGNVITELVNGEPTSPVDEIYDAGKCVLLPGW